MANHDLAGLVVTLFSSPERAAPLILSGAVREPVPGIADQVVASETWLATGPTGLGTAGARIPWENVAPGRPATEAGRGGAPPMPVGPSGLGTSAARVGGGPAPDGGATSGLYCPPAVRDDVPLGEEVNDRLVEWAEQVGIYPGQLDRVRKANFGRLIMLTHPATSDPDRLLAAAKCILAEWATDDHFLDEESLGGDPTVIASRLGITFAAVQPANLPVRYASQLDQALAEEPVAVAYHSAFQHLARYATRTQITRLHHQLSTMFLAYNHEANWRMAGRVPPVWEYLTHRYENSFLPPMVLVDPIAGYEVPAHEFVDRRVSRVFGIAGLASVILNDVYSMARESDSDFDLPRLIAAEEGCSLEEAIERTVQIHNELMHTYEAEAGVLSHLGSLALGRFLTDIWAWLGGNREWHSTTERYRDAGTA